MNDRRYYPGLDGIRALAVCAVIAYHLRVPLMQGGLLGVSVFFTLSGYLISSLLIEEFAQTGSLDLKAFWLRRIRRLLPALTLLLPAVLLTAALVRPAALRDLGWQSLVAVFYVANWAAIWSGDDYFERFAAPGPLDHLWSLAIEEQFYILWPPLCFILLFLSARVRRTSRIVWPAVVLTGLLILGSTVALYLHYDPLAINNTRAYEGTDTRAASILMGALFAFIWPMHQIKQAARSGRTWPDFMGLTALLVVLVCLIAADSEPDFLYYGGELLLSLGSAGLVIGAAHAHTIAGRALSVAPLRWLGRRSYGIYLWHLPVIAFLADESGGRFSIQQSLLVLLLTFGLAAISYSLVENPIRQYAFRPEKTRAQHLSVGKTAWHYTLVLGLAVAVFVSCTLMQPLQYFQNGKANPDAGGAAAGSDTTNFDDIPVVATACRELVHVGDSTSLGLISAIELPEPAERLAARYTRVGVVRFAPAISGARSMVETLNNESNATTIIRQKMRAGYQGCWVLALGTNDPANTRGNIAMLSRRIDTIMKIIGSYPVLWTTSKTLLASGRYQNANMQNWNTALARACNRYKNIAVYDWASEVQDAWFKEDRVHYNPTGNRQRAFRLAQALGLAFPAKEQQRPRQCFIRTMK
ncbi:MAG: acyltransferase [Leptospiraceae bacterium]|nr:acyltransferase [Leptospiraceae bacterium]